MTAYFHHIPGRVRVRLTGVKGSEHVASEVEQHLRSVRGIRTAVANPLTGNVLIHYDPSMTSVEQFAPVLRGYQQQPTQANWARSGSQESSTQVSALAHHAARMILTHLAEMAIERAIIGLVATVL